MNNNAKGIILIFVFLFTACSSSNNKSWPQENLGGDELLFLNEKDFQRIRINIENYEWASSLFENLKRSVLDTQDFSSDNKLWREAFHAREAAIYYRISGDSTCLPAIKVNLIDAYRLDAPDEPLYKKGTSLKNFWSWGMFRMGYLAAWDLLKTQSLFAELAPVMNQRLDEIIERGYEYQDDINRLGNTQFWGITTLGIAGFLRQNSEAVNASINGNYGFKAALLRFRDDTFWPEPLNYDYGYVCSAMLMLAEACKINNLENLYAYEASNGASLKKMMDGMISLMLSDGALPINGDGPEIALLRNGKIYKDRNHFFQTNREGYRTNVKIDLLYNIFQTPEYGWMVSQNPKRDGWDYNFWGWTALTYGIPVKEMVTPSAESVVYPEFGTALIRSDQSEEYWGSDALSAVIRNGASLQFHSHNDHFALSLNAFKKQIYFDFFYKWDYLAPRSSRDSRNETPFSNRMIAHNTVVVDFQEPDQSAIKLSQSREEIPGTSFSAIKNSGPMQILTCSGSIYKGVNEKRVVGVTSDYVLDIFECQSLEKHNYDFIIHSLGKLSFQDNLEFSSYEILNEEFRLKKIDKTAQKPDNVWLSDPQITQTSNTFKAVFQDTDSIGSCIVFLGHEGTEILRANLPYYISGDGWDEVLPPALSARKPMLIVRRESNSTRFVVLHIPFKNQKPEFNLTRTGNIISISGPHYIDEFDMEKLQLSRNYNYVRAKI